VGWGVTVDEYYKDIRITMIQVNIVEFREAIIVRFLNGLNREITNIMEL
jgi:hypothetical protein